MDTTLARPGLARIPLRPLLVLALLALLAATIAFVAGSRQRLPAPFGLADNGTVAYSFGGDLFVRDSLTGQSRLLFGGPGQEAFPSYSPDGQWLGYISTHDNVDHAMVAKADGSDSRELAQIPPTGNAQAVWRPDSRAIAFVYDIKGVPQLRVAPIDRSPAVQIDLGGLRPLDVSWRPPNGAQLLIRAHGAGDEVGLYTLNPDGTGLKEFDLPGHSDFGLEYTLSGSTWSPDGGTIAYNSVEPIPGAALFTSHFRVRLINADATGDRAVADPGDPKVQEAWPVYSPDGRWILVHRWVFTADNPNAEGWLAVMPSDGSGPARDIGPRIAGGENTGLSKVWSPDGTRVLMRADNTKQTFSIDPVSGSYDTLVWTSELPDWQRVAH